MCGGVTHVRRTVYAYRTGSNLTDGYYIHKLLFRHPAISKHLMLNEGDDSQSAAEAKQTDLKEAQKQL
jgi:hypothetical protein